MADNIEKVNQFFGLCQNKGVDIPQTLRDQLLHQSHTLLVEDDIGNGDHINDSQISKNVRSNLRLIFVCHIHSDLRLYLVPGDTDTAKCLIYEASASQGPHYQRLDHEYSVCCYQGNLMINP